ncbi:hypothetical protein Peur_062271 [Populus x canadensis]
MGNMIILFTTKCLFFCFVYFRSVYFFAYQLLDSLFIFLHCLSCWLLHHQFRCFSPLSIASLIIIFCLFSYASIINLCGLFVFNRFVELF